MSSNHNKPCQCGSGKNYKHCCFNRKAVTDALIFKPSEDVVLTGIEFKADGAIRLLSGEMIVIPKTASTTRWRERAKAPKSLLKIPLTPNELSINELGALTKFDRLFAVDTNTIDLAGRPLSITCVVECRIIQTDTGARFEYCALRLFELHNVSGAAENLAWHLLIDAIQSSHDYEPSQCYGLITDSDLGSHAGYNDRSSPYYAEFLLPPNFTLCYASDSGNGLASQAIKACHRIATQLLDQLKTSPDRLAKAYPTDSGYCSHFSNHLINGALAPGGWFRLGRLEHLILRSSGERECDDT